MRSRHASPLQISLLEDRTTPAVTASLSGSILNILGSVTTPGDIITIEHQGAGTFEVSDGATSVGTFAKVTTVRFTTSGENDTVLLDLGGGYTGQVVGNLGTGDNALTINNGTLTGNITVISGNGNDSLNLDSNIKGVAVFNLGNGDNTFAHKVGLNITGTLALYGGSGNDTIVSNGLTTTSRLVVAFGNGENTIALENTTVNGTLGIGGGLGTDSVLLDNVTVAGDTSIQLVGGSDDTALIAKSQLLGNLTTVAVNDLTLGGASSVAKSFLIYGGNTRNDVTINGDVTLDVRFSLPMMAGNLIGNSNINVGANSVIGRDFAVSGTLISQFGTNVLINSGAKINRDFLYTGTNSDDVVEVSGAVTRNLGVATRGGNDTVIIADNATALIGRATFDLGTGDDFLEFNRDIVGTSLRLSINAGDGSDIVSLGATASIGGLTNILLGAGNDTLILASDHTGQLTVDGGAGSDTVIFEATATITGMNVNLGAGDDLAIDNGAVFGGTTKILNGGSGIDTANALGFLTVTKVGIEIFV
ncbi:beta strand repeat-containing protein [Tuwongella immobilis]|uniref:Uncharacterized protein n=1 Tax=Tuwongella immobilis TaxID=692036 RepID=A0A6C2YWF5_9BACT|nr:hypothetical protein [Tuwongella immobilis]VIP05697.1 Uncharacterized protein OS=Pirellula staleyi (strain ATCC 27377 / DSM 6068 / ICPB 4128) GN=Psta_2503 PE=4 SV=1 [Tuwongella immobilis]VTS08750.1 Uncharacterized protein OS=Pirellula staleyi (strain ATCC 27377 / DSM 6068 / ICPB 4128) GN=Psta_2503 PE=4 SV=1 [Tuwongella immobilis]